MIINRNTASVGFNQQNSNRTIPGVRQPDFEKGELWTQTPSSRSDGEYREAIRDLARRDVAAGRFQAQNNPEFQALNRSFVSSESPNRKGTVSNAFSLLARKISLMRGAASNLFKFGNGGGHAQFINGVLQNAEIRDANGNIIALFSQDGGWSNVATSAENARHHEFIAMYNAEWDAARAEANACQKSIAAWNAQVAADIAAANNRVDIDAMGYVVEPSRLNVRG